MTERAEDSQDAKHAKENSFSDREIQIVQMLADGFSNKQIAGDLRLSDKTIKNHRLDIIIKARKALNIQDDKSGPNSIICIVIRVAVESGLIVNKNGTDLTEPLSLSEIKVINGICNGQSNGQIADCVALTPKTVKFYTSSVYAKMVVKNRYSAVAKYTDIQRLTI